MKLRHLILLTSAIGACGALLLAADLYRRLKEAEAAAALGGATVRDDSILAFGMFHTMGLLSLAFFFLALFLMLLSAVRDRQFVAAIENTLGPRILPAEPTPPVATTPDAASVPAPLPVPESVDSVPVEVVPVDAAPDAPIVPAETPPALPEKRVLAFETPPSDSTPPTEAPPPEKSMP